MSRLLHLCSVALLLACTTANAAPLTVLDDRGRAVTLSSAALRVVSLAPNLTELVYDVGAGAALVAVSDFSDYPSAAQKLPSVGGSHGLDLEQIALLKPDLVLAWTSGNAAGQISAIERLGIPVFESNPESLEDVATSLERIGKLTGHPKEGASAAEAFRGRRDALATQYSHRAPVRVFYQVWNRPLMTVGGSHLISHVITLCGGVNIFGDLPALAPQVGLEAAVARDPEVIVAASGRGEDAVDWSLWKPWGQVSAVAHHRFTVIDPALITRHTPRILEGAQQLCVAIDAARSANAPLLTLH